MLRIYAKNIHSHKTLPLNVEFYNFSDKAKILSHITKEKVNSLPKYSKFKNVRIFPLLNRGSSLKLWNTKYLKNHQLETQNILTERFIINKLAFGQTRFAAAADPIEHISEEKFLLQIFAKMET